MQTFSLSHLADYLSASLEGDADCVISHIATLENAQSGAIAFLANKKYRRQLETTSASAVILSEADSPYYDGNKLIVANPYMAYALLAQYLDTTPNAAIGVHPSAVIHPSAMIAPGANIGANAVIEKDVTLAEGVEVGAGTFIGEGASIGEGTKLWANTTVYHQVEIGANCIIHSGTVIGADGFGFANDKGEWVKIPQLGSVVIGDKVEIGANTTVDRGAIDNTEIHNNVIIDNQCQIAHNVVIKEGTAMAGCSVVAGSTTIGKYCQIGGMSGITGHVEICDNVILTGMTMVISNIDEPGVYSSGVPHSSNKDWRRQMAQLRKIGDMNQRIKALEAVTPSKD